MQIFKYTGKLNTNFTQGKQYKVGCLENNSKKVVDDLGCLHIMSDTFLETNFTSTAPRKVSRPTILSTNWNNLKELARNTEPTTEPIEEGANLFDKKIAAVIQQANLCIITRKQNDFLQRENAKLHSEMLGMYAEMDAKEAEVKSLYKTNKKLKDNYRMLCCISGFSVCALGLLGLLFI